MSDHPQNPEHLKKIELLWKERVANAKNRLNFAIAFLKELEDENRSGAVPSPDDDLIYRRAIHAEQTALEEYKQVLKIYEDLTLHGKIPDDQS